MHKSVGAWAHRSTHGRVCISYRTDECRGKGFTYRSLTAEQGFTGQTNLLGILFQCFFSDSSFQILIEFKDYSQLATVQYVWYRHRLTHVQMHRRTETVSLRGAGERHYGEERLVQRQLHAQRGCSWNVPGATTTGCLALLQKSDVSLKDEK